MRTPHPTPSTATVEYVEKQEKQSIANKMTLPVVPVNTPAIDAPYLQRLHVVEQEKTRLVLIGLLKDDEHRLERSVAEEEGST